MIRPQPDKCTWEAASIGELTQGLTTAGRLLPHVTEKDGWQKGVHKQCQVCTSSHGAPMSWH